MWKHSSDQVISREQGCFEIAGPLPRCQNSMIVLERFGDHGNHMLGRVDKQLFANGAAAPFTHSTFIVVFFWWCEINWVLSLLRYMSARAFVCVRVSFCTEIIPRVMIVANCRHYTCFCWVTWLACNQIMELESISTENQLVNARNLDLFFASYTESLRVIFWCATLAPANVARCFIGCCLSSHPVW